MKSIGQINYEAYCKFSGATLPAWNDLKQEIQDAWSMAAEAVAASVKGEPFE